MWLADKKENKKSAGKARKTKQQSTCAMLLAEKLTKANTSPSSRLRQ